VPPGVVLRPEVLPEISGGVAIPTYDRSRLRRSIVHIGVGGFHRSHLGSYVDELCRAGHRDWSIVGSGVLPADAAMASALGGQQCLYSLILRGPDLTQVRIIGSIVDYIHAHPNPTRLVEQISHPDIQMVSLTVTEGGYPIEEGHGRYDPESPMAGKASAFGILAAGLALRRARNAGPLSIVGCDNIVSNGEAARTATLGEAESVDPALAAWVEREVAFPNSMVDRITPATTDADREWLLNETGVVDAWPVVAEPFRQWVIEDTFAAGRPPLEDLDVVVTSDVEPYEQMKLRLLNGSHSVLAYLAALRGYDQVHTAMSDPLLGRFVWAFLDREAGPVLPAVPGIDVEDYKTTIIERFSNPAIADQIPRLCRDGSAKLPKFVLPTLRDQLRRGGPIGLSALALAGWCQYLVGVADDGSVIEPADDPHLETARQHARTSLSDPARFLDFRGVFDHGMANDRRVVEAFSEALQSIRRSGTESALETALGRRQVHGRLAR
jgi:mannitol 2-dehydrogenase